MLEDKLAQLTVDYSDLNRLREENAALSELLKAHTQVLDEMKIQSSRRVGKAEKAELFT